MGIHKFLSCVLLVALGSSLWASEKSAANVILITIDTTRADRMGFLGSDLGLTPNLDEFARRGSIFTHAYAQVPLTTPSHAVILTGTYPQFNHLGDLGNPLAPDLPYLPDLFHHHGYTTAAFVGSQVLDPQSAAAPGFERGFDTYDAGFHSRREGESRYGSEERRAADVVAHSVEWLKTVPLHRPFFMWIHLYDPHDPYDPPEPFKSKYDAAPYNGEIAYVDTVLGKFFGQLKTMGLYDRTLIAIAADHGEAFGEHGEESHGFFLYDETVHVPLVISPSGSRTIGGRVDELVGLIDIAPTLLNVVGIDVPKTMQGRSLLPLMSGQSPSRHSGTDAIYSETNYPKDAFGWSWLRSWRTDKYLYIDAPRRELYLSTEPRAIHNVAEASAAVADTLQHQLNQFYRKTTDDSGASPSPITPEQAEKLQALGYISSSATKSNDSKNERGADPKDKIEIANLLHRALLSVDEGQYQKAIPDLKTVIEREPGIALPYFNLGMSLNREQKFSEAISYLKRAVDLDPQSGRGHFELGVAYGETGDWTRSAEQLEIAVLRAPESDDLSYYLAMAYEKLGRTSDAEKSFRKTLQINPDHYRANLYLGRLLGMNNEASSALSFLQKAVKLQPQSADAHKFLANVYAELGQTQDATRERHEAEQLAARPEAHQ